MFFQAQALLAIVLALPFFLAARRTDPGISGFEVAGLLIWVAGVAGESLADHQLARFKSDPANRGKTCRAGLWRYSRHPNYFFEWLHWWAYAALAVGSVFWWIPVAAPLVMLYFLLKVTGIPPTEAQALASRGDDYREYQRTTSAFIPWFPKKEADRDESDRSG